MSVPRCEVCRKESAVSFGWFAHRGARWYALASGLWKVTGPCTTETENYWILVTDFLRAPERWREHLRAKRWFDETDFDAMLARYAAEAGSLTPQRMTYPKGRRHSRMRANVKTSPSKERQLPRLEPVR